MLAVVLLCTGCTSGLKRSSGTPALEEELFAGTVAYLKRILPNHIPLYVDPRPLPDSVARLLEGQPIRTRQDSVQLRGRLTVLAREGIGVASYGPEGKRCPLAVLSGADLSGCPATPQLRIAVAPSRAGRAEVVVPDAGTVLYRTVRIVEMLLGPEGGSATFRDVAFRREGRRWVVAGHREVDWLH
jgi:hypothetical protein